MKKIILLFTLFISSFCFSQNNLVMFSEQGEQFYLILDGVKQNAKPETNVKVTGIIQPRMAAKIIFANGKTPDLDQKVYFMEGGNEVQGYEFVYNIKSKIKDGVKHYKIAFNSAAPAMQTPPPAGQTVIVYSATPPTTTVTETETFSTTTTTNAPAGNNANIGISTPGVNVNMNVNMNGAPMNSTTSTMTSTTTSSTTTMNGSPAPVPAENIYVLEGYNGPHYCNWPMSPPDFESAKNSIRSKSFEDSKFTIAKQILGSNCMLSSQVKEVMMLFDFENTRLDFAKFAYGKTFDPGNYYKLNDAFQFETSIDELNKYCSGHR